MSYYTYRLCESYRIDNKVRHRNILNIGKLENIRKEDFKLLCDRVEQKKQGLNPLFSSVPENVEKEAEFLYHRILHEKLLDCIVSAGTTSFDTVGKLEATVSPGIVEEPASVASAENTDIQKVDIN